MKNKKGNIAVIVIIIVIVAVTASVITWFVAKKTQVIQKEVENQSIPANQIQSNSEVVSWRDYTNKKLGFSIKIPERVLSDYNDKNSWSVLNIFEDDNSVIFSTQSNAEEALDSYELIRIGGSTVESRDEIVPFLESFYKVKGCQVGFNKDEDSGLFNILIYAKDVVLSPDDPYACFIGGKVRTTYDEISGKLITYQLYQPFFFVPGESLGNNVSDESLASLKFIP